MLTRSYYPPGITSFLPWRVSLPINSFTTIPVGSRPSIVSPPPRGRSNSSSSFYYFRRSFTSSIAPFSSSSVSSSSIVSSSKPVRVRFAPSPTGFLHVGGLRTALYNYAFAKQNQGTFILRIEDTDKSRQVPGSIENLIKTLEWCGLTYDEGPTLVPSSSSSLSSSLGTEQKGSYGPYIQSQRLPLYQSYANRLIQSGHAYRCFCSQERLVALREARAKRGLEALYDRVCTHIPTDQAENRAQKGEAHVIRLRVPPGQTMFHDTVLGTIKFQHAIMDDQVLLKSDGYPTYHLASVIDDIHMNISHIIRGQEWLPSTPKHILLYTALQKIPPIFTHLPLLLNTDKTKLSKRHGDAAVEDFQQTGYLPEALINFVALLGWTPSNGQEILTLNDIVEQFSLTNIHKANAMVDRRRLDYFNNEHIKRYIIKGIQQVQPNLLTTVVPNNNSNSSKKNTAGGTNKGKNGSTNSSGSPNVHSLPLVYRITEEQIPSAVPDSLEFASLRNSIIPLVETIIRALINENKLSSSSAAAPIDSVASLQSIVPKLYNPTYMNAVITAQHERVHTLYDFPSLLLPFLLEGNEYVTYLTKDLAWNPQELLLAKTAKNNQRDIMDEEGIKKESLETTLVSTPMSVSKWTEIQNSLQNSALSSEKHTVYTALQEILKEWRQSTVVFMPEPIVSLSSSLASPTMTTMVTPPPSTAAVINEGYLCISRVAKQLKFTNGTKLYQPLRLCLTGTKVGPAFPDLLRLLGRDVCIQRLDIVLKRGMTSS